MLCKIKIAAIWLELLERIFVKEYYRMYKALSLISGGLDSLLATKLILEQGVQVTGINFFTGFTGDHNYCFKKATDKRYNAKWVCDQLGIELKVVNVVADFKSVLLQPKYGYGAHCNPCLDCKLFMVTQAKNWMEQHGYDFLVTGEVLGQRPMSQRKDTLPLATKITSDLIVRPLSAKLLAPTMPERLGWIKRDLLGAISGRSRKPQIELAQRFGFKEFPQPAGGCMLTDVNFCRRLQDLLSHRLNKNYSLYDILFLRVGRHLRIGKNLKVIIGHDEVENNFLSNFGNKNILVQTVSHPGSLVLLDGEAAEEDLIFTARLAAYFSKGRVAKTVEVAISEPTMAKRLMTVEPLASCDILLAWYV